MLLYMDPPQVAGGARAVTPTHPADHGQLDNENEQGRLHHGTDGRWDHFRFDVDAVPERETATVATLARQAVPDRKGDRQELAWPERSARRGVKRPLEDHRPFSLVVARRPGDVSRGIGSDVPASLSDELQR